MKKYVLQREIPVDEEYDLIVAGGGPAGCAAAACAARQGARVLLVESLGCLGGAGTAGLVIAWPRTVQSGTVVIGGFMRELIKTMFDRGHIPSWRKARAPGEYEGWIPFDPEGLKLLLDDIMEAENVEVRFFTQVIGADREPDTLFVNGLVLSNVEGLRYVKAKAFIDCTGDAVLANICGVPCDVAQPAMPPTLMALLADANWENIDLKPGGGQIKDLQKCVDQAISDGFFSQPDRHVPGIFQSAGSLCAMNTGKIFGMDPLSCRSLSESMRTGRRIVQEYLNFFRSYCKGCETLRLAATANVLGLRNSRYIKGEYCLCSDDYKNKRVFPDQIAISAGNRDIHPYNCSKEEYQRFMREFKGRKFFDQGEYFGIPYSILVPKASRNLWVAGRCVSLDSQVSGVIRNQASCSMLGQAAGVAAAQSIQTGQWACNLNTETLVRTLRKQDAILPQETLSEKMTKE